MINQNRLLYAIYAAGIIQILVLITMGAVDTQLVALSQWALPSNDPVSKMWPDYLTHQQSRLVLGLGLLYFWGISPIPIIVIPWARLKVRVISALSGVIALMLLVNLSMEIWRIAG